MRSFIALLQDLDSHYPPDCTIRLILGNHSAHISKETRAYLATRPNRFKYVLTPTHGSWLNIVETLFGKMTRTFLRQIRVQSRSELKERILLGIAEINEMPVVHRWKGVRVAGGHFRGGVIIWILFTETTYWRCTCRRWWHSSFASSALGRVRSLRSARPNCAKKTGAGSSGTSGESNNRGIRPRRTTFRKPRYLV